MIIFLGILLLVIMPICVVYELGKERGREELDMKKCIEVIPYRDKDIVLISEDYFSQEQAQQIAEVIESDMPIIYKPSQKK